MLLISLLLGVLVPFARPAVVRPDAAMVTRAMTASTIAEAFVEEDMVRVEIEIGLADLAAFANLLPDEIRDRLELEREPLEARLARFFAEDLTLRADDGPPLAGSVTRLEGRRRVVRDEITGEPLPNQPEEAEVVIHTVLSFPLSDRPSRLTLTPPGARGGPIANIGFVLYHAGLPVNDFRYLARAETVDLDWEDPWYSRFRNKNLWRQYEAPLSTYLYVEPYEVRKEVVVRPRDLQHWVDLGLAGRDVIRAEEWGALKQRVADFLITRCPVRIDGRQVEPVLDRIHFIQRTLRTASVLEEPQDLDLVSATLGVIISYPITGLPQEVTLEWELFPEGVERIPTAAVDEAGGLPAFLSADDPILRWQNFLLHPTRARLVELEPPPSSATLNLPLVSLACIVGAFLALAALRKQPLGRIAAVGLLVTALIAWPHARVQAASPFGSSASLSEEETASVCGDLLRNVYRAFDFRAESDIYDVLARSTEGAVLNEVYLETRRALVLENQGGARARIQEVEVVRTESRTLGSGPGFRSLCTWNVAGSVGHWGHLHQRRNRYEAELTVEPVDGQWKITGLELRNETRLESHLPGRGPPPVP